MTTQRYQIYIIDPTKAAPTFLGAPYTYDPFTLLSRFALNAYAERANDPATGGVALPTNVRSNTTEQNVMAGTAIPSDVPPDPLLPHTHNYTPAVPKAQDAQNYLNPIAYVPSDLSVGNALPSGAKRGVVITTPGGPVECYGIEINYAHQAAGDTHSHCVMTATTGTLNMLRGVPSISLGDNTEANSGDTVEFFLAKASDVLAAGVTGPSGQTFTRLNGIPRFEFQPSAATYYWVFSSKTVVDSLDDNGGSPSNSVTVDRALKPKSASGTTFPVFIQVFNPTAAVFDPGMQVAVHNKTKKERDTNILDGSTVASDPALVYSSVVPAVSPTNEGTATYVYTVPALQHAVEEGDQLQFFLRILGDNSNLKTFTITSSTGGISGSYAVVTSADIIVDNGITVHLTLTADYGLILSSIAVSGSLYQSDEVTLVPDATVEVAVGILDGVTVVGAPVAVPVSSGNWAHTFSPGGGFSYTSAFNVNLTVAPFPAGTPNLNFYPRLNEGPGAGIPVDTDHTKENVPIKTFHMSSSSGVVTATVNMNADFGIIGAAPENRATYPHSLALLAPLAATCGRINFIGEIINGPPPSTPTVIPDGRLVVEVVAVDGAAFTISSAPAADSNANNLVNYNFGIGALTGQPGARDLCVGQRVNIRIRDFGTAGHPIVPIGDSSPTTGIIEPGSSVDPLRPPGSLTITITSAMVTANSISGSSADEYITLNVEFGAITSVEKFTFSGTILDSLSAPIPDGATLFIHNVSKNLSKAIPVGPLGAYSTTFTDSDFGLAPGTAVASVSDTIRYILFEDLFPSLPSTNSPTYPDPAPATNDRIITPFTGTSTGASGPAVSIPAGSGPPIIPAGTKAVVGTLSLAEIRFAPTETPPRGAKTANFTADFVPTVSTEITIQSKPIEAGPGRVPVRAVPYVDVILPTNTVGGIPFEFAISLSNNANDATPRFDPILGGPDLSTPGHLMEPDSTLPFRLHIFTGTSKTAATHALALKVKLKRNDSTGPFQLNSWGIRWWNSAD